MGSQSFLTTNVFEEALKRVNFIFDECDDVIVSMSGGKDSTVVFNLALTVAKQWGRLPLKVFWLDQEAEWEATDKYMSKIMHSEDVKPYWFQIPFDFTNTLSFQDNFLRVWDKEKKDLWIRPQSEISIKINPSGENSYNLYKQEEQEEDFINERDVAKTISNTPIRYEEVTCPSCGKSFFIKR